MTEMSKKEIRKFLMHDTLTGKLATVKKDGSPHVVPIWFILDDIDNSDNIIFTTCSTSVKARNIQRDDRVSICIDDQTPPFSFVIVYGIAKIQQFNQNELLKWATKIAERYMGKDLSIVAEKNIAAWD
jgi:PPOX class probable F420-dependent enzyme